MLTKLIDLSQVDLGDDEYNMSRRALDIDLHRRLPRYSHVSKPEDAKAFRVVARQGFYFDSFTYEITYGTGTNLEDFKPIGSSIVLTDGELPSNR